MTACPSYYFDMLTCMLVLATIIALVVVFLVWHKRDQLSVRYIIGLEICTAIWAFANIFEGAATTPELKLFWSQVSYLGIPTTPVFFFLFAQEYGRHRRRLSNRTVGLLFVIPAASFLAAITNSWHLSLWQYVDIDPITNIGSYNHGPLFWIMLAYVYIMLCSGLVLLFKTLTAASNHYRIQSLIFMIGAILPFIGNLVYVSGHNPIPGMDWTPLALAVTGIILAWGIVGCNLFNRIPVARKQVVEAMDEGVLVFDQIGRVVDANPASGKFFKRKSNDLVGLSSAQMPEWVRACLGHKSNEALEFILTTDPVIHVEALANDIRTSSNRSLGRFIILRDVTKRKVAEECLRIMATTDSLTGLCNRGRFMQLGEKEVSRSQRFKNPLSVLMIDVDHFKSVNDTFGHDSGDKVLKDLAQKMTLTFRDLDVIGRIGGEEFAVLLPETDEGKATQAASRLWKSVREASVMSNGNVIKYTVSIGVGSMTDSSDLTALLQCADKALYCAKQSGRDRVEIFNATICN